jgi:uncharacterized protein YkwD
VQRAGSRPFRTVFLFVALIIAASVSTGFGAVGPLGRPATGFPARPLPLQLAALTLPTPAPVASTATVLSPTVAALRATLLGWLNAQRIAAGLVPYRGDGVLASLAAARAANLAAAGTLSHDAAGGSIGASLSAQGYRWYLTGEAIGFTTAAWGSDALTALETAWTASSVHHELLLSDRFNYVGIGIAYRETDGSTWASVVMVEAPDHTPPVARIVGRGRVGTTIRWLWWGTDPLLQTHTAGLATFDVQYRVDAGLWRTIRAATTTTSLVLRSRPVGHTYWLRVRARDRQGTLSPWSAAVGIRVP